MYQAEFKRFLEAECASRGHQFDRPRPSDNARNSLRAARARKHAKIHFRQPDLAAFLFRDADVASHRDLKAASHRVAVQSRDNELRRLLEARKRLIGMQTEIILKCGVRLRQHRDTRARGEEFLARAAQHNHVNALIHSRAQNRGIELLHHLVRVGIRRGIVHLNDGQATVVLILDQLFLLHQSRCRHYLFSVSYCVELKIETEIEFNLPLDPPLQFHCASRAPA